MRESFFQWGEWRLTIYGLKVIFYLFFILAVCLLPVYLFRKNWKEAGIAACVLVYFFILNKDFIWGNLGVYHDTRAMYENIFSILKQWLDANIAIGWNPYMNAGEPLYLFSNNFLWPVWAVFCWMDRFIQLNNPHALFNLFWFFLFVNFCIGGLLLFYILYDDFKVSLFCFVSLVFSSMFIVNLCQPAGLTIIYYFPYILFSVILSVKRKNIYGIALAFIFLGIAANHYLPYYLILSTGIFGLFLICFYLIIPLFLSFAKGGNKVIGQSLGESVAASPLAGRRKTQAKACDYHKFPPFTDRLRNKGGVFTLIGVNVLTCQFYLKLFSIWLDILRRRAKVIFLALIIALLAALPALFLSLEVKDYVSPTRGAGVLLKSETNWQVSGYQPAVKAFLSGYKILLGRIDNNDVFTHHAFYFGILPLVFIVLGFFACRRERYFWIIFFSMAVILFLGTGDDFWGFRLLRHCVPGFNVIRHTFGLAHFVSFLLICLSGYGLKWIMSRIRLFVKPAYLIIIILIFGDLSLFYIRYCKNNLSTQPPDLPVEISYPQQRTFYPGIIYPKNPDFAPLILKQAVLTDYEGFISFRNQRLNDMLKLLNLQEAEYSPERIYFPAFLDERYSAALGAGGPLIYFTGDMRILPANIPQEQLIKEVYEDALRDTERGQRRVFFSEEDIDFEGIIDDEQGVLRETEIDWTRLDDPNRVELFVDASRDGFLVRLENFHRNWKAFIDAKPAPIYRANYSFQAIRMPRGKHKVVFQFSSVYSVLFYIHILFVFLNWVVFNFYLYRFSFLKKGVRGISM